MINILIILQIVVLCAFCYVLGTFNERLKNVSREQEKALEIDDKQLEKIEKFNEQYNQQINDILSYK